MTTGIIGTIGPKSHDEKMINKMIAAGMTIIRCNFSHCTFDEYKERLAIVKKYNKQHKTEVAVLADLRGPRIRIGVVADDGIDVKRGQILTFVTIPAKDKKSDEIPVDDHYLHVDVKKGDPLIIANGAIELVIESTSPANHRFTAKVLIGGTIYSRKGINVPATNFSTPVLTDKDIKDLKFVLKTGVDYVALSFVKSAEDIKRIKKIIGKKPVKVIAKIESRQALINIDEIIQESDGVMVARGDLGVEIPDEEVPIAQKKIVRKCHLYMKPAIVATQMMSSMVDNPFPTRAEVSDVANAVFEGAHIVMLSDETANGDYPLEAIKTMRKVVSKAEEFMDY